MGFRERTVTGSLVDADGSPIATAQLSFQLDKPLGYTSTHVVINRIFNATTDAAGLFSITLWCDEDSLLALDYTVSFPTANAGLPQNTHTAKISLAYQDGSAKDIGTLIAESQPPPTSVPEATWRLLIEDEIATASLGDLSDVDLAGLVNGNTILWDSVAGKWKPGSGGGVGGSNTQIQFNDGGVLGGDPNLTYDKTNDTLTVKPSVSGHFGILVDSTASGGYGIQVNGDVSGANSPIFNYSNPVYGNWGLWNRGGTMSFESLRYIFAIYPNASSAVIDPGDTSGAGFLTLNAGAAVKVPLVVKLAASQTANAFEVQPNGSTSPIALITPDGGILARITYAGGTKGLEVQRHSDNASLFYVSDTGEAFVGYDAPSSGIRLQPGYGIMLTQAAQGFRSHRDGIVSWDAAGSGASLTPDIALARAAANVLKVSDGSTGGGALQFGEMTAPAAPATNNVRLYAEDNGSGKTRLMAKFPTGAAQQVAIEP